MTFIEEARAHLKAKSTLGLRLAALQLAPCRRTYENNFAMNIVLDELQHRLPTEEYKKFYSRLLEKKAA